MRSLRASHGLREYKMKKDSLKLSFSFLAEYESLQMLQSGNTLNLIIYILASVIVGIALVALGYWLVK